MADDIRNNGAIQISNFNDRVDKQFWTQQAGAGVHTRPPKAQFRFKVVVPGMALEDARTAEDPSRRGSPDQGFQDENDGQGGIVWYCKSVDKPGIDIDDDNKDHYQTFGVKAASKPRVTSPQYKPINMTIIDPYYPNAARKVARLFRRAGLNDSKAQAALNPSGTKPNAYGEAFIRDVGEVQIHQLDEKGNSIEIWTLFGAYPDKVDFGKLDYSSNDLVEISLTFYYTRFTVEFPNVGNEEYFKYFKDDAPTPLPDTGGDSPPTPEQMCRTQYGDSGSKKSYDAYVQAGSCASVGVSPTPPTPETETSGNGGATDGPPPNDGGSPDGNSERKFDDITGSDGPLASSP